MWLFYSYNDGYIPMGSDGQMKISGHISDARLKKTAESFLGKRAGCVYLMADWTQKMCELGPRAFEEYIAKYGKVVAHS